MIQLLPATILSVFALDSTIYFSLLANKRANDKILKELFTEFNTRYDAFNNLIKSTKNKAMSDLRDEELYKFDECANLCAEQYFWYKKKRIDIDIWDAWFAGMQFWYKNHEAFRDYWNEQMKDENSRRSYYLKKEDKDFLKNVS